jgi:hypothetical protein
MHYWQVQCSKYPNKKSRYTCRFGRQESLEKAWFWYVSINIGNGYKKRLLEIEIDDIGTKHTRIVDRKESW